MLLDRKEEIVAAIIDRLLHSGERVGAYRLDFPLHLVDDCLPLGLGTLRFIVGLTEGIDKDKAVFKQTMQFLLKQVHITKADIYPGFKSGGFRHKSLVTEGLQSHPLTHPEDYPGRDKQRYHTYRGV